MRPGDESMLLILLKDYFKTSLTSQVSDPRMSIPASIYSSGISMTDKGWKVISCCSRSDWKQNGKHFVWPALE